MGIYCKLYQITNMEERRIREDPECLESICELKEELPSARPRNVDHTSVHSETQRTLFGLPREPIPPAPTLWFADFDKNWDVLHFFLTGKSSARTSPVSRAILGGEPVNGRSAWILTPGEVQETAQELSVVTSEELCRRFDPVKFVAEKLYWPVVTPDEAAQDLPLFLSYFNQLVAFYRDAARCGNAVLFVIA